MSIYTYLGGIIMFITNLHIIGTNYFFTESKKVLLKPKWQSVPIFQTEHMLILKEAVQICVQKLL